MTISYKLNFGCKAIAKWSVERQTKQIKPPSRIVLIPKEVLIDDTLKPYFRRALVISHTKTKGGFHVELEAILMPCMVPPKQAIVNSLGSVADYSPI